MKSQSKFWQNIREIILVATAVWFCSEAGAAPILVVSSADSGSGTLRSAISSAGPGDIISFTNTLNGSTITLTNGQLLINQNFLSIIGPGPTNLFIINTNGRVFDVTSSNVTIAGLRLTGQLQAANGNDGVFGAPNGGPGDDAVGGGIEDSSPSMLIVSNCIMDHCKAVGGNGGNAFVTNNVNQIEKGNGGDGGNASGGAIDHHTGDLICIGCTFHHNVSHAGNGGTGRCGGLGGNGGNILARNGIPNNGADGGALQVEYGAAEFSIIECTFTVNYAVGGDGGNGGDACPSLQGGSPVPGGAGGNGGDAMGGGIDVEQGCKNCGNVNCRGLDSCTIYRNYCDPGTNGQGGAGALGGAHGAAGSKGTAYGCGLFYRNMAGCLKIANTIIAGNLWRNDASFTVNGPDVYVAQGQITDLGWNLIGITNGSTAWVTNDLTGSISQPLDPLLGPLLFNNGGSTPTMAPLPCGSPAIDAGYDGIHHNGSDQIGQLRPVDISGITNNSGDGSDIGAFELQSYPKPTLTVTQTPAEVIIAWTTNYDSCYMLQTNSDLTKANWGNLTSQNPVFIPLPLAGNMFYRLLLQ
jgi:hypothetical protein